MSLVIFIVMLVVFMSVGAVLLQKTQDKGWIAWDKMSPGGRGFAALILLFVVLFAIMGLMSLLGISPP